MRSRTVAFIAALLLATVAAPRAHAQGGAMLGHTPVMSFVAAQNAKRAKEFYRDKLGLRLVREEPIALVFDANGTMLRVQLMRSVTPHPYTVLGWEVRDIAAAVAQLKRSGVAVERFSGFNQDELGIWTAEDRTRVAWLKDPDGNVLSLTEFPEAKRLKR